MNSINKLISDFLIFGCVYYEFGKSLIPDEKYDLICLELLQRFDELENSNHIHKNLITKEMLVNQSCFDLSNKFPNIVKNCALDIINNVVYKKKEIKNINDLF